MSEEKAGRALDVMAKQLVIAVQALRSIRDNVSAQTDWRDVETVAGDAIDAIRALGAMPEDDGPYYIEVDATPPHPPLAAVRAEQDRDDAQHARDMAAEDGDYDTCEPTL
jgi:hypothetical protein